MAREKTSYFHYIHRHDRRQQGFTLLELVIAVSVMSVLLAMAAPSFSQLIETNKIKRLATEVEWFLVQAKSEAVMRGRNVYIHKVTSPAPQWCLFSSLSAAIGSSDCSNPPNNLLGLVASSNFELATLDSSSTLTNFYFDPIYGKPESAAIGGNYIYSLGDYTFKTVLYSPTGRIYSCIIAPTTSGKVGIYEQC
ncbi:GspH/FimT family pseudopilin [Photobacterium angustum]|uniref:GspH/FimT family pseudopilin n=1 Tax=Photobacterium angustum TaxID=661 RepID=UPI0009BA49B5|nr:GspH/FimT family pseudopilin [Photobacterium angustum]PSV91970.1 prepilin-type N-terminal cleavage/methylation domain-containing protein [Photobacterium angustum]PSW79328.1 prepilin-type N-terminal cleavage/methylation domain-containing protein [Photobacterium angustum]